MKKRCRVKIEIVSYIRNFIGDAEKPYLEKMAKEGWKLVAVLDWRPDSAPGKMNEGIIGRNEYETDIQKYTSQDQATSSKPIEEEVPRKLWNIPFSSQ